MMEEQVAPSSSAQVPQGPGQLLWLTSVGRPTVNLRALGPTGVLFWVVPTVIAALCAYPPFAPILPAWPYQTIVLVWAAGGAIWLARHYFLVPRRRVHLTRESAAAVLDDLLSKGVSAWEGAVAKRGLSGIDNRLAVDVFTWMARELLGHGEAGHAIVLTSQGEADRVSVTPMDTPFEPVPLDQRSGRFVEVFGDGDDRVGSRHGCAGFWSRLELALTHPSPSQVQLTTFAIITVFFVLAVWARGTGTYPVPWVVLAVFFAVGPLALLLRRTGLSGGRNAWVFPGGVAIPRRRRPTEWDLVTRDEGILCWYVPANHIWLVTRDGLFNFEAAGGTSPREAEVVVRAWLSSARVPSGPELRGCFGTET